MNLTPHDLRQKKETLQKITMLTAYDYAMASAIDNAGVDIVLVGDSLGMVALGYDSTVPVTMDEMLHHCRAVSRAVKKAMIVGDMPFMSYQISTEKAIYNAGRFLKEGCCHCVKLEGGSNMEPTIGSIVKAGIPVMAHIGLTPQTATSLGGYKVQGRDAESAKQLLNDAEAVERAGAFAVVLECVPTAISSEITRRLSIPTIGIGAGAGCDGQVLVTNDLLGMFDRFTPKFIRKYANFADTARSAILDFIKDVNDSSFPSDEESFKGGEKFLQELGKNK